jgi:6-pyruvoyltetrahydropterin/6-carboxytetrahydropterin synthase
MKQRKGVFKIGEPTTNVSRNLKYHNKRVAITKEVTFDAAHHLEMYEGKCRNVHGHTYRLSVTISGYVNEIGIVMDFYEVKKMIEAVIMKQCDHKYLNEALPEMNTTVDNIIVWIWEQFVQYLQEHEYFGQGCRLEEIRLFETPTGCATLKREWMLEHE